MIDQVGGHQVQRDTPERRLSDGLQSLSARALSSLGRALKFRLDRIAGGRRLEAYEDRHTKTKRWRVVAVEADRRLGG